MAHRIRCFTLFDITETGVANRNKPDNNDKMWLHKRSTQCNFDTILQVISLRSQPEVVAKPSRVEISNFDYFGFVYEKTETSRCWTFDFEIQHSSVFQDGISELGALYNDCDKVPMILLDDQSELITSSLNISPELKNIYFEVV